MYFLVYKIIIIFIYNDISAKDQNAISEFVDLIFKKKLL